MEDIKIKPPSLRTQIEHALADAQENGSNETRTAMLRLISCALNDRDICARERGTSDGCPENELAEALAIMVEQREESAREYDDAGRIEEAMREREEIGVVKEFLPMALDGEKLEKAVQDVVDDLGASKLKDLGRCMKALKERHPGQIDIREAGKSVRTVLTGNPS